VINIDNHYNFEHYNRDMKFSYHPIPTSGSTIVHWAWNQSLLSRLPLDSHPITSRWMLWSE